MENSIKRLMISIFVMFVAGVVAGMLLLSTLSDKC